MCSWAIHRLIKGYRCLDLSTRWIIISRHVAFNEFVFPFAKESLVPTNYFDLILDDAMDIVPCSTNPADAPSRGDVPAPVAASSSPDVEQHRLCPGRAGVVSCPHQVPLMCPVGVVPYPHLPLTVQASVALSPQPAALPPSSPSERGTGAVGSAGPAAHEVAPAPAPVAAPTPTPAAPPGRFGNVYSRRVNGPVPVRQFSAATRASFSADARHVSASHLKAANSSSEWYCSSYQLSESVC